MLREWLASALSEMSLTEESHIYLLGRGVRPEALTNLVVWESPTELCPDPKMRERLGPRWERLEGRILFPLYSPRGTLLGFDSRTPYRKDPYRFLLPDSKCAPVWIGMPEAMPVIWAGGAVVIVEGYFDVCAMHHVLIDKVPLGSGPAQLSHDQIAFLQRFRPETHLVYDMDKAGLRGAEQAYRVLQKSGVSCYVHRYGQEGDDPGLIWQRGGRDLLQQTFSALI